MIEFIKNLQGKPESTKKVVMWCSVVIIMIAIFGFWIFNFSSEATPIAEDKGLANLKKEMPGIWQTLKSQVNSLQELWAPRLR